MHRQASLGFNFLNVFFSEILLNLDSARSIATAFLYLLTTMFPITLGELLCIAFHTEGGKLGESKLRGQI